MEESKAQKDSAEVVAVPETIDTESIIVQTAEETSSPENVVSRGREEANSGPVECVTKENITEKTNTDKELDGEPDSTKQSSSPSVDVTDGSVPDGQSQEKALSQGSPSSLPEKQSHSDQKKVISTESDHKVSESAGNASKLESDTKESAATVEVSRNSNNAAESDSTLDIDKIPDSSTPIAVDISTSGESASKLSVVEQKLPEIVEDLSKSSKPGSVDAGGACEKSDNDTEIVAKESSASDSFQKKETDSIIQSKTESAVCKTDDLDKTESQKKADDLKTEEVPTEKIVSDNKTAEPIGNGSREGERRTASEETVEEKVHDISSNAKTGASSGETKTPIVEIETTDKKEEPKVVTIVEQVDETSDVQDVESKTEECKDHHAPRSEGKDSNVNNNARDVKTEESKGAGKETVMNKDSVRSKDQESVKNKEDSESKHKESEAKAEQRTEGGDSKKSAPKKEEKNNAAVKDDAKVVAKDRKDDVKKDMKDTRDRPSKSYSAQRTANRGNRRGNVEEGKDTVESTKASETKGKDERKNKVEDRRERDKDRDSYRNRDRDREKDRDWDRDRDRDRDRNRDAKGRDQPRDRGSQKETESEKR